MALLEVNDLCVDYRVSGTWLPAVEHVGFEVDRGEIVGLVGESGCGKSTVARTLMRLLPKNGRIRSGRILFDGEDIVTVGADRLRALRWNQIAMIFQGAMNVLNPVYRVGSQVVEAIQTHENVSRDEGWRRAEQLIANVGIDPKRARSYPHELSGGMKQRIGIAMAMALKPALVIADEPTTALDVISQDNVLAQLIEAQRDQGNAMVIISHDMGVIAETCDRVAVMYAGGIVELGSVRDIFHSPAHPYTLGLKNAIPKLLQTEPTVAIPGFPPAPSEWPAGCRFAPRCPFREDICEHPPPWAHLDTGHAEACHFPHEAERFRELAVHPRTWAAVEQRMAEERARQLATT